MSTAARSALRLSARRRTLLSVGEVETGRVDRLTVPVLDPLELAHLRRLARVAASLEGAKVVEATAIVGQAVRFADGLADELPAGQVA